MKRCDDADLVPRVPACLAWLPYNDRYWRDLGSICKPESSSGGKPTRPTANIDNTIRRRMMVIVT